VKKGGRLKRGEEVGLIGQTGYCAYPHLHVHMMLPGEGAAVAPAPGAEGGKSYPASACRGANVNPGPCLHDMYAGLDPGTLVDFHKVTLKALDGDGNRVEYPHYSVKGPDGRTWDVGIHDSTSVPAGKNPFTFIAERRKLGLRGEVTVSVERSGQEVIVPMRRTPEPDKIRAD